LVRSFVENVLPWFGSSGKLQPTIDRVFRFDQVPEAHRYVEENGSFGKVIVRVD
jgi:NADPH:quinone reductase-like Zn-dependent oxidoreductase